MEKWRMQNCRMPYMLKNATNGSNAECKNAECKQVSTVVCPWVKLGVRIHVNVKNGVAAFSISHEHLSS
jgi:NAD(P)H-nitrite reductase large subunit